MWGMFVMRKITICLCILLSLFILSGCRSKYARFDQQATDIVAEDGNYIFYSSGYWIKDGVIKNLSKLLISELKEQGYRRFDDGLVTYYKMFDHIMVFNFQYHHTNHLTKHVIGTFDIQTGDIKFDFFYEKDYSPTLYFVHFLSPDILLIEESDSIRVFSNVTHQEIDFIELMQSDMMIEVIDRIDQFAIGRVDSISLYEIRDNDVSEVIYERSSEWHTYGHIYQNHLFVNHSYYHLQDQVLNEELEYPDDDFNHILIGEETYEITVIDSVENNEVMIVLSNQINENITITITIESIIAMNHPVVNQLLDIAEDYDLVLHIKGYKVVNGKFVIMIGDPGYTFFIIGRRTYEYAFIYDIPKDKITYIGYTTNYLEIYEDLVNE